MLAHTLFDVGQPFLAPWAALLTVHATVFGTLRHGVQQVGATVVGVLVAFAAGHFLGVSALSIGVAVLVGLAVGSVRGLDAGRPATDEWIARTEALDDEIDEGRRVLGQARESGRLNPRPGTRRRMRATEDFAGVLHRLGQSVAETRSMARTVALARVETSDWDPAFRDRWLDLLRRSGEAVRGADAERLAAVRAELDELVAELGPDGQLWPVYGALIVNLRNILESLDVVATAQPIEVGT